MRSAPLSRTSRLEPGHPPERRTPLARNTGLQPVPWSRAVRLLSAGAEVRSAATKKGKTGFSPAVRLQVRTRAGNGDPAEARCEACGGWLGPHAGDFQHIVARGMGGCKLAVTGSAANCTLLCRRCHDLCEARDPHMEAAGFWAKQGTDPRLLPMMLASEHGSGVMVWRAEDGKGPDGAGYLLEAPGELAA